MPVTVPVGNQCCCGPTEVRLPCCPDITIRCPAAATMSTPSMDVHTVLLLCDPAFDPEDPDPPPADVTAACSAAVDTGLQYSAQWMVGEPTFVGTPCAPDNIYTGSFRVYFCCRDNGDGTYTPLAVIRGVVTAPDTSTTTAVVTSPIQGTVDGDCVMADGVIPAFTAGGIAVGAVTLNRTPVGAGARCDNCEGECPQEGWGTYNFTVTDLLGRAPCATGSGTYTVVEPAVDGGGSWFSDIEPACEFPVVATCAKGLGLQNGAGVVTYGVWTGYYSDQPYYLLQYGLINDTELLLNCPDCTVDTPACIPVSIEITE